MDALLVDGDEIELTPDPPWMWMGPVRLAITALPAHKTKAKGKFVVWDTEIMQAGLLAAGKMYSAPGFATPGAVITCTIIVNPGTMSKVYKELKLPIATVATSGTFLAAVAPAVNPATGVPDAVALGFEQAPRKKSYTLRYSTNGEEPALIYQNQSLFTFDNTPSIEDTEGSVNASPPPNLPAPTEATDPIVSFSDLDRPVDVSLYQSVNDLP